MLLKLLRYKISLCNLQFFLCEITAHVYHFHTVLQCRLDAVDIVGCRDEEYVGQVVIDVQVVIMECCILLWVKRFKKRRRRIAFEITAYLVDLVENDYRV